MFLILINKQTNRGVRAVASGLRTYDKHTTELSGESFIKTVNFTGFVVTVLDQSLMSVVLNIF